MMWLYNVLFHIQSFLSSCIESIWNWISAEKVIALLVSYFAIRDGFSKVGHKFEVIYCTLSGSYQQPYIYEMFICNKKNKTEVLTEINVLIGSNCALNLHKFREPLILNPYEMKRITFKPVSVYAINNQPINMKEIFEKYKESIDIIFTTPNGTIKAKRSTQIPYASFIGDALKKGAFYFIYHREYPVNNKTLDFKIKYFGDIKNKTEKGYFYIYQDGVIRTDFCLKDNFNIDLTQFQEIESVKKFIQNSKLLNGRYTVKIYERDKRIDRFYETSSEVSVPIFSKYKYFLIEPLIRFYQNKKNKKTNTTPHSN